jgi:Bacterial Ig-like domain (group 2)
LKLERMRSSRSSCAPAPARACVRLQPRKRALAGALVLLSSVAFASACGDGPQPLSVSLTPANATLALRGTQQFNAEVTGTLRTAVTWSVEPSGAGSVDANGLYAAPNTAGTFTVRATLQLDPTRSATATITVGAPDAGAVDGGARDAGSDAGALDAGSDAGPSDAGSDAGPSDAGSDAGSLDAGSDAGSLDAGAWPAGNPDGGCSTALPPEALPADVSHPAAVIGTGTPASCTFAALSTAAAAGGVITFDCGPAPVTIPITATLNLPTTRDTVIDGGRKITLDGGGAVQILRFDSPNFMALETRVTLQHLRLINGQIAGSSPIPTAPLPCSQGFNAGEGGAVYVRDGNLSVIDSIFESNQAAPLGPDVAGGAIRMLGSKHGITIAGSSFRGNSASNGGAVGCLFSALSVYGSLFEDNAAIGHDANYADASKCPGAINNGQHEVGSGGNGGALYSDGNSVNVLLCGDRVVTNHAGTNAFGGGLFFTSNDFGGTLTIADTTMTGNTGGSWTQVTSGSTKNAGTAVGTNTKSLTITNSTLQGVP